MSDTYNDTMSQGAFVGSHIWWVWGTRGCLGDVIRKFPKRGFGVLVNVLLSVCPFFWTGADCSCCDLFTLHVHACSPHHTDSNDKTWPECQVTQDLNPQQLSIDWLFQLLYFYWVLVEHKLRTLALGASGLDGSQQAAAVGFGGLTLCLKFVEILVADKMKRLQRRIQWPAFESIPNLSLPHFRDVPFTSIHIDLQHVGKAGGMKTSRHQVCGRCEKPIPPEGRFCGGCFPDVIQEVRVGMAFPWLNQVEWWMDDCSCTYSEHPWTCLNHLQPTLGLAS